MAPTAGRPHAASPCEVRRVPILYDKRLPPATTVTFASRMVQVMGQVEAPFTPGITDICAELSLVNLNKRCLDKGGRGGHSFVSVWRWFPLFLAAGARQPGFVESSWG